MAADNLELISLWNCLKSPPLRRHEQAVWDAQVPGQPRRQWSRQFLQGADHAGLNALESGDLLQTCWLTATGRLRAVLELRLDAEGADVIVLAGEPLRFGPADQVIFPADRVRLQPLAPLRRLQWLGPRRCPVVRSDAALPDLGPQDSRPCSSF